MHHVPLWLSLVFMCDPGSEIFIAEYVSMQQSWAGRTFFVFGGSGFFLPVLVYVTPITSSWKVCGEVYFASHRTWFLVGGTEILKYPV